MTAASESGRLSTLRVAACEDSSQSLLLSLEAVLAIYGRRVARDELSAVLGDAFMLTYAAEARQGEQWNTYGWHAFLETAARVYGLELRDLHPPDAAPLPLPPPEFEGHFTDSYLPLVRTALEHDHPVLAWMGWPSPRRAIWGVVNGYDSARGCCVGQSIDSVGGTVALAAAPVQVYTVQEYRETSSSPSAIIGTALDHAAVILGNRLPAKFRVATGVAALEKWRAAASEDSDNELHPALVRLFSTGRRRAAEFFRLYCGAASADQGVVVEQYAAIFEEQVRCLAPLTRESDGSGKVHKELPAVLGSMIALERRAAAIASRR